VACSLHSYIPSTPLPPTFISTHPPTHPPTRTTDFQSPTPNLPLSTLPTGPYSTTITLTHVPYPPPQRALSLIRLLCPPSSTPELFYHRRPVTSRSDTTLATTDPQSQITPYGQTCITRLIFFSIQDATYIIDFFVLARRYYSCLMNWTARHTVAGRLPYHVDRLMLVCSIEPTSRDTRVNDWPTYCHVNHCCVKLRERSNTVHLLNDNGSIIYSSGYRGPPVNGDPRSADHPELTESYVAYSPNGTAEVRIHIFLYCLLYSECCKLNKYNERITFPAESVLSCPVSCDVTSSVMSHVLWCHVFCCVMFIYII